MLRKILKLFLFGLLALRASAEKGSLPGRAGYRLLFSGDGNRVLCQLDQRIWVFNLLPRHLDLHLSSLSPESWASLSADGALLAIRDPQGCLAVYDCRTTKKIWQFTAHEEPVERVLSPGFTFDSSGSQLLYPGAQKAILFEAHTGKQLRSWSWPGSTSALNAFSPDGKLVFHGSDAGLQALSTATGVELAKFPISGPPMMVSFRNNRACLLYEGGELQLSYPTLKLLAPGFPAAQTRPDGLMRWRRTPSAFEVLYRDQIVYQGPSDHQIPWWPECGGFPVSSSRTGQRIGLYADNGTRIPGDTDAFVVVPQTNFVYVNSVRRFTGYDMRTGKSLGDLRVINIPAPSPRGGKLAAVTAKGIVIVDVIRSLKTGRLAFSGEPL